MPRADSPPLTLAVYGDSISATGPASFEAPPPAFETNYQHLIRQRLPFEIELGTVGAVFNGAKPGWTTRDLVAAFSTRIDPVQPDVAVILFGTNDHAFASSIGTEPKVPADEFERNLTGIVARIRFSNPSALVVVMSPPFVSTLNGGQRTNARLLEYAAVTKLVAEASGAVWIDANTITGELVGFDSDAWCSRDYTRASDGLHPNSAVHRVLFDALLSALNPSAPSVAR